MPNSKGILLTRDSVKRVHSKMPIFSVRITKDYRAVGIQKDGEMIWFWIGSHGDYEKLLRQIRQH